MTGILTWTLILALIPATAIADQTGEGSATITVTVKNSWGEVPGATVELTAEAGTSKSETSNSSGAAVFSSLAAGDYRVKAELEGFEDFEQTGIAVAAGDEISIEAMLVLTQFSSSITVSTANRREQLLLDVAEPTTLIDELQILDTGGLTAKDVLSEQAGAGVVVHAGGGQGYVSINGVGNAGVLILIDGRRYLGRDGNGNFNLEDLDISGAERIEVVKGAGSALYGTDALGGVINIITRKAKEPGSRNKLEVLAGSHSDWRVTDTFARRGELFGVTLIPSYRTYGGFDLDAEDPQTQGQPESEFLNFQANGDYEITPQIVGRLFTYYSRRDVENNFFAGATQLGEEIYDQQKELVRWSFSPELDFVFSSNTTLNLRLTEEKYNREETDVYPDRTEVVPPWEEWNTEVHVTGRQSWQAFGQAHLLQVGYEYRHQEMERTNLIMPGTDSTRVDRDLHVGWFQQGLNLGSKFSLIAGLRYDRDSEYGKETSPKLSAVYAPTETTRVRASWGEGFRAPRFGELFIEIPYFFVGNPDLNPETSETLTVGFTYFDRKFQAAVDYYDTELDNAIVFDLGDFRPPFTYKNIEGISTREGFNTEFAVNLPGGFVPSIAYSYIEAKDSDGDEIGGFATHSGFVKLLWSHPSLGLRVNLRGEYRGEETPGSSDGSYTPAYELWNLQVSKSFIPNSARKFRVWARVDNLFDETDIYRRDPSGQPLSGDMLQVWEDGRNYHVGVAVDMDWPR
ncbi:MAG: TonB-dependent receptor [bacterium]|nr:TonB-dependent receptor [bacterium]